MEITRLQCVGTIFPEDDGPFVDYDDYKKLEEKLAVVERELDELKYAFKEAVKFAVRLRGSLPK